MSNDTKLEEQVKKSKSEYYKNWRKNNRSKVKASNKRYWEKRALKKSQENK